jgi:DNA end-binding protein Ku
MPRPSWSGHLRLSLVSCPIYISPATSESERIRLNQINPKTGNRISLHPVDAETGEPVERGDLVKGYEYERGQYVILAKDEIDALHIESSRTLDITQFVDRDDISPLYFDVPYFVHPDGSHASDAYRVIAHAMSKTKKAAIGRIVLSSRERMVALEPFEGGMLLSTLRAENEVRAAEFEKTAKGAVDPEMVQMAVTIIQRLGKKFDPGTFHDRYQDALRELVEAKMKGVKPAAREVEEPSNVIDLMAALKQSVAAQGGGSAGVKKGRARPADRRQQNLLLPVKGGGKAQAVREAEPTKARRKKAG